MSIFEEQLSRKPNLYPWTEQFIESMHNGFWTDKEFSFQSDVQQYRTELTEQEQEIIARTLSANGQIARRESSTPCSSRSWLCYG